MASDGPSHMKRHIDESAPGDQGGGKRRKITHSYATQEKSRIIDIKIHFNNINIDFGFTWKLQENTTIEDLYKKINRKMQQAFALTWDKVRVNDLVKTENSLRAMFEPGTLRKDLGLKPSTSKNNKNILNLNDYRPDRNLWALVEETWNYQSTSTLRLDVVMPNRKELERELVLRQAADESAMHVANEGSAKIDDNHYGVFGSDNEESGSGERDTEMPG